MKFMFAFKLEWAILSLTFDLTFEFLLFDAFMSVFSILSSI